MAVVVPTAGEPHAEAASLRRLCQELDDRWWVLGGRPLAGGGSADIVLHPDHGIAIVVPPGLLASADAVRSGVRKLLDDADFADYFAGELPIVVLRLDSSIGASARSQLLAAFAAAPALGIGDPDWVAWVVDALSGDDDIEIPAAGDDRATLTPGAAGAKATLRRSEPASSSSGGRPAQPGAAFPSHPDRIDQSRSEGVSRLALLYRWVGAGLLLLVILVAIALYAARSRGADALPPRAASGIIW